jgi:alpha-L-fucosidase
MCLVSGRVGNDLGDYDSAGDNQISVGKVKRPWETPVTMNDTWGFRKDDHNWKSAQVLIRQLATTSSRGGNYLLNVGPTSEGVIPPESVERLAEIGKWTTANGESIYATSANPFPYELPWGVITTKPGRLYLHVFQWPQQRKLEIYGLRSRLQHAYLVANHATVRFEQWEDTRNDFTSLALSLPAQAPDPHDSVIALEISGNPDVDPSLQQQPDRTITLPAYLGDLNKSPGSEIRLDSRGVIERWFSARDSMAWSFKANHPGAFDVQLITSQQKYGNGWDGGQRIAMDVAAQHLSGVIGDNGRLDNPANPYWPYVISNLGHIQIAKTGKYTVSLKPEDIPSGQKYGLALVWVRLVPVK